MDTVSNPAEDDVTATKLSGMLMNLADDDSAPESDRTAARRSLLFVRISTAIIPGIVLTAGTFHAFTLLVMSFLIAGAFGAAGREARKSDNHLASALCRVLEEAGSFAALVMVVRSSQMPIATGVLVGLVYVCEYATKAYARRAGVPMHW